MIKCLRARRGNVHRKQNCFRGVLLFKTHFAEFCVKSVCKTEPWNWAVRLVQHNSVRKYRHLKHKVSCSYLLNLVGVTTDFWLPGTETAMIIEI